MQHAEQPNRIPIADRSRGSPSALPDASCLVVGLNASEVTAPLWPLKLRSSTGSSSASAILSVALAPVHYGTTQRQAIIQLQRRLRLLRSPDCYECASCKAFIIIKDFILVLAAYESGLQFHLDPVGDRLI